jgi:hypothetical protein
VLQHWTQKGNVRLAPASLERNLSDAEDVPDVQVLNLFFVVTDNRAKLARVLSLWYVCRLFIYL